MSGIVLRVRRDGRLLGSWALGQEQLEFELVDPTTGREVARFAASGPARAQGPFVESQTEEVPFEQIGARVGVPQPAPAASKPWSPRPPAASLRDQPALERAEGDDLTLPLPDLTSELRPGGPSHRPGSAEWGDAQQTLVRCAPPCPEVRAAATVAAGQGPAAEATGALQPATAEVWVRRRGEWRTAGGLEPRQRVTLLGGWIRHATDGRLVVHAGDRMTGSATLPDGRSVEIRSRFDPISLPQGASVLLRCQDHGIYVRSELPPELSSGAGLRRFETPAGLQA